MTQETTLIPFSKITVALLSLLTLTFMSMSCGSGKKASSDLSLVAKEAKMAISFPGVESNHRSTIAYTINLEGRVSNPVTFKDLLVDSIKIPLSVSWDGTPIKDTPVSGDVADLLLRASRYTYDPNARNKRVEEVEYQPSGKMIAKGAEISYLKKDGSMGYFPIDSLVREKPIYYP